MVFWFRNQSATGAPLGAHLQYNVLIRYRSTNITFFTKTVQHPISSITAPPSGCDDVIISVSTENQALIGPASEVTESMNATENGEYLTH